MSVLNQTYKDFELLVILNGCTDNTEKIVSEISKKDSRLKILETQKSRVVARNFGIIKSSGDIIALQDSDDEWFPKKLQYQIEDLKDCDVCGTQIQCVDENWNILQNQEKQRPLAHDHIAISLLTNWNCLANSSVVFKKDVVLKSGIYEENFPLCEDYHLWLKMLPYVRFKNSDKTLINYMVKHNPSYDKIVPIIVNLRNFYRAYYTHMGIVK